MSAVARSLPVRIAAIGAAVLLVAVALVLQRPEHASAGAQPRWQPAADASWQWDLQAPVSTRPRADIYDVDLFDTPRSTLRTLRRRGTRTICYVSAGSWEEWRPDAGRFPESVLGNDYDGWEGERWLDIRALRTLAPIMRRRIRYCARKGFDGIEYDNVASWDNDTGFAISKEHQLRYNRWLAREAHRNGLAAFLKNDPEQARALVRSFDGAITEDCGAQGWCRRMRVFRRRGKPVLMAEYTDTGMTRRRTCRIAARHSFSGLITVRDLTGRSRRCG